MLTAPLTNSAFLSSSTNLAGHGNVSRTHARIVLIASSDSSLRERLRHSLTGLRWQVLEASGGAAASWEASQVTQLEALVIDPWLPDLEVHEFLKDFHREYPNVDLMMTDGVAAEDSVRSPYHQELLYALRRSQDVDTAAWNTAMSIEESTGSSNIAALPALAPQRPQAPAARVAAPVTAGWIAPASPSPVPNPQAVAMALYSAEGTKESDGIGMRSEDKALELSPAAAAGYDRVAAGSVALGRNELAAMTVVPTGPGVSRAFDHPVLQRSMAAVERIPELVGSSPVMLEVSRRIRLVAERTTPVLIEGPTGSGKEVVAEALHRLSKRARKPFVAINCAAIPEALLEAELFGHTRGAFTGAVQGRIGRIESADGGTLFLDEIGEMPLSLQSKLLRFFESGELQRIGDNETIRVDVRIVAATHQPLAENAQKGSFRADLYYRLAVFLIHTPALSEHMNDLPQFVAHFMERMGRTSPVKRIDASAMFRLSSHGWPGNVRELEHVLERAAILAGDEPVITASEIDFGLSLMN